MGSEAHVVVVGDDALLGAARRRIDDLEQRWSRFRPDSEISRMNAGRGRPFQLSPESFVLVLAAVEAWRLTDGLFDPTVLGDMVRAGYDRPFQAVAARPGHGVSMLTRHCGGIVLDADRSTVTLPADAGFDPGGIGKGLAADIVADELMAAGASGVCVNLGGDVRVEGEGPDDGRWLVDVENAVDGSRAATVALAAGAVATSTTRKRAWTIDGDDLHHLIDPHTGVPSAGAVVSATVLARRAALAEVATKAALLTVPGAELLEIEDLGCDGLVVDRSGQVRRTAGLDQFLTLPDLEVVR